MENGKGRNQKDNRKKEGR
jgi:hypothetical protein